MGGVYVVMPDLGVEWNGKELILPLSAILRGFLVLVSV